MSSFDESSAQLQESVALPAPATCATARPKSNIAIVIVAYNGRDFLPECLRSIFASDDGALAKRVFVVDNASTDDSALVVQQQFPQAKVLSPGKNLGFAGANNLAWQVIEGGDWPADYLCLLNQDTVVESGWLLHLVEYVERQDEIAAAQPKILLHPDVTHINTIGNRSHFLGFGFTQGYGAADNGEFDAPRLIDFASGAAMLIKSDAVRRWGLFEDDMFMYLEDADLGWKLRQLGYEIHCVPASRVYHKYRFNREFRFYYELERNRWWLLLVYYRLPTLLLLAPALFLMEVGQWIFALSHGCLWDKWKSYAYFYRPKNVRHVWRLRRAAQRRRKVSDRAFSRTFTGTIDTPELQGVLVRYVANPILGAYWYVARRLIFW